MNGAHLASPIRGELGYAHWPQLGTQSIGHQIWGPLGKQGVCPSFALTAAKFVFSNSGNFRAKANPPKPRSCSCDPHTYKVTTTTAQFTFHNCNLHFTTAEIVINYTLKCVLFKGHCPNAQVLAETRSQRYAKIMLPAETTTIININYPFVFYAAEGSPIQSQ